MAHHLGDLKLTLVSDGGFKLDGGAMFGVVPKPLWQRAKPADERNRIQMATNCLLVERGDDLLLIDTGIGDKNDEKFADIFGLEGGRRLPESIEAAGYALEDVTHVLMTHLHFDHCGWNTLRASGGEVVPTFPNARYVISRGELEHADAPNQRDRASYLPDNWRPLVEAGLVDLFDGEAEPVPGVRAIEVPGHNANMCVVRLDGGGAEHQAIFWADLVPTAAHVAYPWIMGYDLYPLDTLANKEKWIPEAAAGGWLSIFEHEFEHPFGRLVEAKPGRFRAEPVAVD